jgi:hypothetical protein
MDLDEKILTDMIACFLHCDKPGLIDYLHGMLNILQEMNCEYAILSSDEDTYEDAYEEEPFEVVEDENGFLSLK